MISSRFLFVLIFTIFIQCKAENGTEIFSEKDESNEAINTYYQYIKEYKNKEVPPEMKPVVEKARKIAELELISIFKKPEKYGSDEIYLDNADYNKISFIVKEDEELRLKFGKYLKKND